MLELLPIFYFVVGVLLILIIKKCMVKLKLQTNHTTKSLVFRYAFSLLYIMQPGLFRTMIKVFECSDFTTGKYLNEDTTIDCESSTFVIWSIGIFVPFIILCNKQIQFFTN